MEDYPQTLAELEQRFATEEACRNYLQQLRWPEGFHCVGCGGQRAWLVAGSLLECSSCGHQHSVIAGTIFQDTRKPLSLWFRAAWWITSQKNGASALGLQRVLGLGSYQTAWTWLHKFRRAMVRPGRDRLAGDIDVDETYWGSSEEGWFGREKGHKTLIAIAAQHDDRKIGRIRMQTIPDASAESLEAFIGTAVEPGSVVYTDGWSGYGGLKKRGYRHVATPQGKLGRPGAEEDLMPRVHRIASLLKRWLMGTHQGAISGDHLDYYLDEFTFRFNRRTSGSRGKLFYRLLQQAVAVDPAPYNQIIKGVRGRPGLKHNC